MATVAGGGTAEVGAGRGFVLMGACAQELAEDA